MTIEIKKAVKEFLDKYDFVRAEWDGLELTCYVKSGEPFGASEFVPESQTAEDWDALEKLLSEKELQKLEV